MSRKRKFDASTTVEMIASKNSNGENMSQVQSLEEQILKSRRNWNSLLTLIELARWNRPANSQELDAVVTLCRVFCHLMAAGHLTKTTKVSRNEAVVMQWLGERLHDVHKLLLDILREGIHKRQKIALMLYMDLFKEEAIHLNLDEEYLWTKGSFFGILQTLVSDRVSNQVRKDFVENFADQYNDIRLYTLKMLSRTIFSTTESADGLDNAMFMLLAMSHTLDSEGKDYIDRHKKKIGSLSKYRLQRRQAQETWMTLFNHELSKAQRKCLLAALTHRIAPWFLKIELLMDLLVESFNSGGSTSLLALSGLFYLIQEKNLDYPHFYEKVYSLLHSEILHSKHRSRFFKLLNIFLESTHLPAALVASFIKRLSRLCLHSPPSGIVAVVPWIYNLLKCHPICTFMIHRDQSMEYVKAQDTGQIMMDPFQMDACDPMHTKAEDSSIWEVQSLQSHYHPNVATIAKILSQPFTKQSYNLADFFDHSYSSMLSTELAKDIKRAPVVEHEIPKAVFKDWENYSCNDRYSVNDQWDFDSDSG